MLQINNAKTIKKSARALEKFLDAHGIDLGHGQALEALAVLAGYKDWNSTAHALSPEGVDMQLDDFERSHIALNDDVSYGAECAMVAHTGFELRYSAKEDTPDYVRVCDPLGREIAYWVSDEWEQDPQVVMGAILGALVRGRPVEYSEANKRTAAAPAVTAPVSHEVQIQDVPLEYASNVLLNGAPFTVWFRDSEVLGLLQESAGDPDAEDDYHHIALRCSRTDDDGEWEELVTLHTLRSLKWDASNEWFVSPDGDKFEFFIEHKFKPAVGLRPGASTLTPAPVPAPAATTTAVVADEEQEDAQLFEVEVFALVSPSANERVGRWVGSAINAYQAEHRAVKDLWTSGWKAKGSPHTVVKRADEAQYGPFKVYLDGALYAEVPYFRMAVDTAEVMLEIAEECTVTSVGGTELYKTVR